MKKNALLSISFIILILAHLGCVKKSDFDIKNVQIDNWSPDWALPLLNSTLSLDNLLKPGEYVTIDQNGLYSIHYNGNIFSVQAKDYIKIPSQHYTTPAFPLTAPITLFTFIGTYNDSFSGNFNYSDSFGSGLEHIILSGGKIKLKIVNTYQHNISATIVFPSILKDGHTLSVPVDITYPSTTNESIADLSAYVIDLTNAGTTQNYLPYKLLYTIKGTGNGISPSNSISADIELSELSFSFLDGYLGNHTIPIPYDTIHLDIFNNSLHGGIFLEDPKFNLSFVNSFGVGIDAGFDTLYGVTNNGNYSQTHIPHINIPSAPSPMVVAKYRYTIDKTNSTIQNIFNPTPNKLIYKGAIQIHAGTTVRSFITDTSSLSLIADAELPAYLRVIDFSIQDNTKLVLPKDTNLLQHAEFKMQVINSFPLYGNLQLYFADSNYNVLDSLVQTTDNIFREAPVDANGIVNGSATSYSLFVLDHERYSKMAPKTKFVMVRGVLKSSSIHSVQIHTTNNVNVKLGCRFKLNATTTGL